MDLVSFVRHRVDRARGLDFLNVVKPETQGFDPTRYFHSSPSGGSDLIEALKAAGVGKASSVLDIGCGKGSAIRSILKLGVARADGLEVIPSIAATAEQNFARLKQRRTTIFLADATTFEGYGEYTHIYMYNPFPKEVMSLCLERILTSRTSENPSVTLVYCNPTCHETIMASGSFTVTEAVGRVRGHPVNVYRSI